MIFDVFNPPYWIRDTSLKDITCPCRKMFDSSFIIMRYFQSLAIKVYATVKGGEADVPLLPFSRYDLVLRLCGTVRNKFVVFINFL